MYIRTKYLRKTSSNYTNSIIAAAILIVMVLVELCDGVVFDLAECSILIEMLTLVNVVLVSTLLIRSVSTYSKQEHFFGQMRIIFLIRGSEKFLNKILKGPIRINAP